MRSGAILQEAVRRVVPGAKTAKILIQRDEETAQPVLMYSKLPPKIEAMNVLLCDPMLATGGSALTAIKVLKDAGVPEERITSAVDEGLDARKYIVPGLGDFGDRYYGTAGYDEGFWG